MHLLRVSGRVAVIVAAPAVLIVPAAARLASVRSVHSAGPAATAPAANRIPPAPARAAAASARARWPRSTRPASARAHVQCSRARWGTSTYIVQSLAEIARVAALPSAVGFTMGCSVAGHQLDDPVLDPVLAELDRRGTVVFLHPVGQENTTWLAGHNLAWLVGAPFGDTAAALRLVLAAVPDRYPNLRFIVPYLGV